MPDNFYQGPCLPRLAANAHKHTRLRAQAVPTRRSRQNAGNSVSRGAVSNGRNYCSPRRLHIFEPFARIIIIVPMKRGGMASSRGLYDDRPMAVARHRVNREFTSGRAWNVSLPVPVASFLWIADETRGFPRSFRVDTRNKSTGNFSTVCAPPYGGEGGSIVSRFASVIFLRPRRNVPGLRSTWSPCLCFSNF